MTGVRLVRALLAEIGVSSKYAFNDKRVNGRRIKIMTDRLLSRSELDYLKRETGAAYAFNPKNIRSSFFDGVKLYFKETK